MAKYTVTHSCGHDETIQLIGKRADREWRIRKMEQSPCWECGKADRAAAAQAANADLGLPELTGTPKQIAWAEQIRARALQLPENQARAMPRAAEIRATAERYGVSYEDMETRLIAIAEAAAGARDRLETEISAKWWIDEGREYSVQATVNRAMERELGELRRAAP